MTAKNGNAPTAAAEWGQDNVETVTLPSGNTAELRKKLNIWALVRTGVMSAEMVAAFDQAAAGRLEDLSMAVDLNDTILQRMFVTPEVFIPESDGDELPDGMVHVDRIDDEDVQFVLERAFGGARQAAAFRGDGPGADGGGNGKGVGQGSKRTTGGRGGQRGGVRAGSRARSSGG